LGKEKKGGKQGRGHDDENFKVLAFQEVESSFQYAH